MSEMGIALGSSDFDSLHPERIVLFLGHGIVINRLAETRPARAGVELIFRTEKRYSGNDIDIDPLCVVIPIGISKGRFGPALLRHIILFGSQFLFQFGVGNFRHIVSGSRYSLAEGERDACKRHQCNLHQKTASHLYSKRARPIRLFPGGLRGVLRVDVWSSEFCILDSVSCLSLAQPAIRNPQSAILSPVS